MYIRILSLSRIFYFENRICPLSNHAMMSTQCTQRFDIGGKIKTSTQGNTHIHASFRQENIGQYINHNCVSLTTQSSLYDPLRLPQSHSIRPISDENIITQDKETKAQRNSYFFFCYSKKHITTYKRSPFENITLSSLPYAIYPESLRRIHPQAKRTKR